LGFGIFFLPRVFFYWPTNGQKIGVYDEKILSSLILATLAIGAQAGTKIVTASGTVEHKPEFAKVTITVISECYPTAQEAHQANKAAAIEAKKNLANLLQNEGEFDKITVSPGTTSKFERNNYGRGNQEETTCKNTWQQRTTITFQTGRLEGFSETFSALQTDMLKSETGTRIDEKTTYTEIGSPSYDVCPKTRAEMSVRAKALAYKAAIADYKQAACCCGICGEPEIEEISTPEEYSSRGHKSAYMMAEASFNVGEVLEIDSKPISVTESVTMKFKFPTTTLKCDADMKNS